VRDRRGEARRELERAGARQVIATELQSRVDAAATEVQRLTAEAEDLRRRVEEIWDDNLRTLTRDHDRRLEGLLPKDMPDECYPEFEAMSGLTDVYGAFHNLLVILHNTAPDYPIPTHGRLPQLE